MSDELRDVAERLLDLVDTRKGDMWWNPCCESCYYDPWHRERFGDAEGVIVGDAIWQAKVPKCDCVCHEARRALGREDEIHDPRWVAPERVSA